MKVLGGIAILLAALLGLGAYNSYNNASKLRAELGKQGGFTKFVGNVTGLNDIDRTRVQAMEDQGQQLAIAAGVIGLLGLLFCASGASKPSPPVRVYYDDDYEEDRLPRRRRRRRTLDELDD
jgi:hypothetical protein